MILDYWMISSTLRGQVLYPILWVFPSHCLGKHRALVHWIAQRHAVDSLAGEKVCSNDVTSWIVVSCRTYLLYRTMGCPSDVTAPGVVVGLCDPLHRCHQFGCSSNLSLLMSTFFSIQLKTWFYSGIDSVTLSFRVLCANLCNLWSDFRIDSMSLVVASGWDILWISSDSGLQWVCGVWVLVWCFGQMTLVDFRKRSNSQGHPISKPVQCPRSCGCCHTRSLGLFSW